MLFTAIVLTSILFNSDYSVNQPDICPFCKTPTDRMILGGSATCMYFPVIEKADGTFENTGHNTVTLNYRCLKCGKDFMVKGDDL